MKTFKKIKIGSLGAIFMCFLVTGTVVSQEYTLNNKDSKLSVLGTSSLHDWEVVAEDVKGTISVDQSNGLAIQKLKIEVVSESLKSGKSGMDKNTYKALKTGEHKTVTFDFLEAGEVTKQGDGKYKVNVTGNLKIAGVTKKIPLSFILAVNGNTVNLTGEKTFKMTEYKITPPKALMGTITTGDEITIKFNVNLSK